jgi:D-threonate/D-erythronate kinase
MLIIIADDLTGAAEVSGIASSHGLKVKLYRGVPVENVGNEVEVLVLDLNTRAMNKNQSKLVSSMAAEYIKSNFEQYKIFKKVDSVFRGHIAIELDSLMKAVSMNRAMIIPNNPSSGRVIKEAIYWVGGQKIEHTHFAHDPHFPATSSSVETLLNWNGSSIYSHVYRIESPLSDSGVFTFDAENLNDIQRWINQTTDSDIVCGGGDSLRVFLKKHYGSAKEVARKILDKVDYTIYINGSMVINDEERLFMLTNKIPTFYWKKEEPLKSIINKCKDAIKHVSTLTIYSIQDADDVASDVDVLSYFAYIAKELEQDTDGKKIHFVLSGGATAEAVIHGLGKQVFEVIEEKSPGVVTFTDYKHIYTTKPGSYVWGASLKTLYDKT